jgi:hypothetical protein
MMLQYLVLVRKALRGMKHLRTLATMKYEFQNRPKKDRRDRMISMTIRPSCHS